MELLKVTFIFHARRDEPTNLFSQGRYRQCNPGASIIEDGFSWEAVAGIVGIVTVLIGFTTAAVGYGQLKASHEDTKRRAERANEKADEVAADLSDFREKAAREFVSVTALEKVAERAIGAIDRLADRFL